MSGERADRHVVLDRMKKVLIDFVSAIAANKPPVLEGVKSRATSSSIALVEDDLTGSFRLCAPAPKSVNKTLKSTTSILLVMQFSARLQRASKTCT